MCFLIAFSDNVFKEGLILIWRLFANNANLPKVFKLLALEN